MRRYLYEYIRSKPDLLLFLRERPDWYRRLSRHPERMWEMEREASVYFKTTWPDRLERMAGNLQMVPLFVQLLKSMDGSDEGGFS
jgi:hypothetical protein